jgi:hypothetical protein
MFPNLSRRIAALYKWLGLISILVLTVATFISVANVFMRGQLAQSYNVQMAWSFIFAAAIEVNIFRLFFEWRHDNDEGAKWLGIGLVLVAGVALSIEGLQQSIGFNWSDWRIQVVIGIVIILRVVMVTWLLGREGSRLGLMVRDDATNIHACQVSFPAPVVMTEPAPTVVQEIDMPAPQQLRIMPPKQQNTATRIRAIVAKNPDIKLEDLARKAGVSVRTAQRHKPRQEKEA